MPFRLSSPEYQTFELERTDLKYGEEGDDPTTVTIREARQHEHAQRQDQWNKFERRFSNVTPDEVKIVQEISFEGIKMLEARMTLVASTLEDENGNPLFPSKKDGQGHLQLDMSNADFERAWGMLPMDVAQEIHEKIVEVNPMWGGASGEGY